VRSLTANTLIRIAPPRKRKAEDPVEPATKRTKPAEDDEEEDEEEDGEDDEAPEDDADEQEQEADEPAVSLVEPGSYHNRCVVLTVV
jgi:hypothetical protein